jgi:CheY-like chemotaxis protein
MRILVVEDEKALGTLLGRILRRLGHEPLLALHPRDALFMLGPDIDMVITDIEMPDMNGVDLARAIREVHHDVPIVFCTGSDPEGPTAAAAAEIGPVLAKLWRVDSIRDLIDGIAADPDHVREVAARVLHDMEPRPTWS